MGTDKGEGDEEFKHEEGALGEGVEDRDEAVDGVREKEEMEAILPVEKKADWRRKRKKSAGRRSERASGR